MQGQLYTFARNQDFVASLVRANARFMIVGGLAVHFYVPERAVGDLDLLIDPTRENAQKILSAMRSPLFTIEASVDDLIAPKRVQLPAKIDFLLDILTPGPDIEFAHDFSLARDANLGSVVVKVAAASTLRKLLAHSREPKHLRDLQLLRHIDG
jgi:hypothetical protein